MDCSILVEDRKPNQVLEQKLPQFKYQPGWNPPPQGVPVSEELKGSAWGIIEGQPPEGVPKQGFFKGILTPLRDALKTKAQTGYSPRGSGSEGLGFRV